MAVDETGGADPNGEAGAGGAGERDGERRRAPVFSPPAEARFPGWLLPLLGAAAAGIFAGWMGAVFGGVVGFLIWRARA